MDLNHLIFPHPNLKKDYFIHANELLFIPKKDENSKVISHIPALLLQPIFKSKSFLIFFHSNVEDIFTAFDLAEEIHIRLNV